MNIVSIQIAARELHEAAARLDILNEDDGFRYGAALERYNRAVECMTALLERGDEPAIREAKRAA